MGLGCKRCGSEEHVKNGLMRGQQRYLCKGCGLTFTDTPTRGKPLALKAAAVLLDVRVRQGIGESGSRGGGWDSRWWSDPVSCWDDRSCRHLRAFRFALAASG